MSDDKSPDLPPGYQENMQTAIPGRSRSRPQCSWFWAVVIYAGALTAVVVCLSVVGSLYINKLEQANSEASCADSPTGEWKEYQTEDPRLEVFINVLADKEMVRDDAGNVNLIDFDREVSAFYHSDADECEMENGVEPSLGDATDQAALMEAGHSQTDETYTVEELYYPGAEVTDLTVLPAELHALCAGKQTYWSEKQTTSEEDETLNVMRKKRCRRVCRKERYECGKWLRCKRKTCVLVCP